MTECVLNFDTHPNDALGFSLIPGFACNTDTLGWTMNESRSEMRFLCEYRGPRRCR